MTITGSQIVAAFRDCGIPSNDILCVHSNAGVVAQLDPKQTDSALEVLQQALQDVVGSSGTIVVPTFSYDFTKSGLYDPQHTPSEVGMFSNWVLQDSSFRRTAHPIFSVAVKGAASNQFLTAKHSDCFGPGTIFDMLFRKNAWICGLGCGTDKMTMIHYAEQKLPVSYRFYKSFNGHVMSGGQSKQVRVRYFVRNLSDDTKLNTKRLDGLLRSRKQLHMAVLGRFPLYVVKAQDLVTATTDLCKNDPHAIINAGA